MVIYDESLGDDSRIGIVASTETVMSVNVKYKHITLPLCWWEW